MARRSVRAAVLFAFSTAIFSAAITSIVLSAINENQFNIVPPFELTKEQREWPGFEVPMRPMDIIVHVLSPDDFIRLGKKAVPSKTAFKDFIAWSTIYQQDRPCEVYLPAGYKLNAQPSDPASGQFSDSENSDTVAHEFLHCNVGNWHK